MKHIEEPNLICVNNTSGELPFSRGEWTFPGGETWGRGYSLIWAIKVCEAPKGMVFQPFWS